MRARSARLTRALVFAGWRAASSSGEAAPKRSLLPAAVGLSAVSLAALGVDAFFGSDRFNLRRLADGGAPAPAAAAPTKLKVEVAEVAKAPAATQKTESVEAPEPAAMAAEEAAKQAEAAAAAEAARAEAARAEAAEQAAAEAALAKAAKEAAAKAAQLREGLNESLAALVGAMEAMSLEEALNPEFRDGLEPELSAAEAMLAEATAAGLGDESFESAVAAGRGHRAALRAAASAAAAWRQARGDLVVGLQGEAMEADTLQATVEAFHLAGERLGALGLSPAQMTDFQDGDATLGAAGVARLTELRLSEAREEARDALRRVLDARGKADWQRNAEALEASLENARAVGLESCPATALAEALIQRPESFCERLIQDDAPPTGAAVSDYAVAAKTAAASEAVSEEELRARAERLAQAVVAVRDQRQGELRAALDAALQRATEASLDRARQAQEASTAHLRAVEARRREAAEQAARAETAAVVAEAQANVQGALEQKRMELREALAEAFTSLAGEDGQELEERIRQLVNPLQQLEAVRKSETNPQACSALSTSLLRGATALNEGQPDARETLLQAAKDDSSGFVAQLLAALPEKPAMPNDLNVHAIGQSFEQQLPALAAAALTPPAQGLLGSVVAHICGRLLAMAYAVRPGAEPEATDSHPSEAARRNLAKLAECAKRFDNGDATGALQTIEALTGNCGRAAAPWAERLRQALLVQQTLRALRAKAECLNASLPP